MSLPIRSRLTLLYVGVLAVILVAFGAFLFLRLKSDLLGALDDSLSSRAAQISLGYQGQGQSEFQDVSDASLRGLAIGESAAQIISTSGGIEDSTGDPVSERSMISPTALARAGGGQRVRASVALGSDGEEFRVLAIALSHAPGSAVLVVATSLEEMTASVHRLLVLILAGIPIALLAAGLGGWLLAGRALQPMARMTREAEEIGADRPDERIEVPRTADELQRLARTLNAMLDRLQGAVETQRRFVADASHDLRTPLTVMLSELDVGLEVADLSAFSAREMLASNREEIQRMAHMVDDLLTLAAVDEGHLELVTAPIQLRELALHVVDELRPLAAAAGVHVRIQGAGVRLDGDRERLKQVLANLVDNAVRYSDRSADVRVSLWEVSGEVGFTVTDTGPGIPPAAIPHLFDRFFRVDPARSSTRRGSGLGLAICRDLVAAHGGRIWVESSEGRGSSFSVALPATQSGPLGLTALLSPSS
ncbi:MAG: sensor histidine kinase [Actinomycetota bacterium]